MFVLVVLQEYAQVATIMCSTTTVSKVAASTVLLWSAHKLLIMQLILIHAWHYMHVLRGCIDITAIVPHPPAN